MSILFLAGVICLIVAVVTVSGIENEICREKVWTLMWNARLYAWASSLPIGMLFFIRRWYAEKKAQGKAADQLIPILGTDHRTLHIASALCRQQRWIIESAEGVKEFEARWTVFKDAHPNSVERAWQAFFQNYSVRDVAVKIAAVHDHKGQHRNYGTQAAQSGNGNGTQAIQAIHAKGGSPIGKNAPIEILLLLVPCVLTFVGLSGCAACASHLSRCALRAIVLLPKQQQLLAWNMLHDVWPVPSCRGAGCVWGLHVCSHITRIRFHR
jgi:hypothetical protein